MPIVIEKPHLLHRLAHVFRGYDSQLALAVMALALAGLIMGSGLKVRLQCLIPAVENAISGNAFRPGDVLASRKGRIAREQQGREVLGITELHGSTTH